MLTCKDCQHFKDGKCDYGYQLDESEDAYDCIKFEDNGDGVVT